MAEHHEIVAIHKEDSSVDIEQKFILGIRYLTDRIPDGDKVYGWSQCDNDNYFVGSFYSRGISIAYKCRLVNNHDWLTPYYEFDLFV